MNNGSNETEEAAKDRNSPVTAPAAGHAAGPAEPEATAPEREAGHPDTGPETYPAEGAPTVAPGPAEEEDQREPDDRGLTTDAGSSD
jgi:hypothetical protein